MYDIITFGSATQDVFMSSNKLKEVEVEDFVTKKGLCAPLGSKIEMDSVFFAMGGTGANTAVTFSRQGFKVGYQGLVGKDVAGQGVRGELEKHGVSSELLKETDKYPTAYSVILSLPNAGRTIFKKHGACHEMTENDIDFDRLEIHPANGGAGWFYLGSLSGLAYKVVEPIIRFAKEKNIKVAANPVGNTQLSEGLGSLKSLLSEIDILIVNQEEASLIAGLDIEKEEEVFKRISEMAGGIVVVTKGPDGVLVFDGKDRYSAGIPESDMVERTGAGDAFGSGFVSGWIEKQDIVHAIQLGTANATAVLQELGAANGLLKKSDWGPWSKVEVKINDA